MRWFAPSIFKLNPVHRQTVAGREVGQVERPGETFRSSIDLAPRIVTILATGILAVNFYRIGWLAALFLLVYAGIHHLTKQFAKYSHHGAGIIAYPMAVCVGLILAVLGAILVGQVAIEASYVDRIATDAEHAALVRQYKADMVEYGAWERERALRAKEREERNQEREKIRLARDQQATRQMRYLVTLAKEGKLDKTTAALPAQESVEEVEFEQIRKRPIDPPAPTETAIQFMAKWQWRMKLFQFSDLGVALLGYLWLSIASIRVNQKGRLEVIEVEHVRLLEFVVPDREVIALLPQWTVSPSLPEMDRLNADSEAMEGVQESGEGIKPVESEIVPSVESAVEPVEAIQIDNFPSEVKYEQWNGLNPAFSCISQEWNHGWNLWNQLEELWPINTLSEERTKDDSSSEIKDGTPMQEAVESTQFHSGMIKVGEGNFGLYRKVREGELIGYDLRRVKTEEGQKKDVCFVNVEKFASLMADSPADQEATIERWIREKQEKNAPSIEKFKRKKARR